MRHFTQNLSLENHTPAGPMLSLEEEAVVIADTTAEAGAIEADLIEAGRAESLSDSLEDLAVIADNIEEATPVESALIDTAANMAVAGTDVPATDVVPATESYIGKRIATEELRVRAGEIWKRIKDFIKRIWEKVEAFFHKYFGQLPRLKSAINDLQKRVDDASSKSTETRKITLSSGLKALMIDGKVVKNEGELGTGLKDLAKVASYVYGDHAKAVVKLGDAIADTIGDFDSKDAPGSLIKMSKKVAPLVTSLNTLPSHGTGSATRFPDFATSYSAPLFNNKSLASKQPKVDVKSLSDIQVTNYTARSGVVLVATTEKEPTVPSTFEFETMSLSAMTKTLDALLELVTEIESFQRGKAYKDVLKSKTAIAAASEKASTELGKLTGSDDATEKAAVPYFRAMLNFNSAYSNWANNPSVAFSTDATATIRSTLAVVSKSLATYK